MSAFRRRELRDTPWGYLRHTLLGYILVAMSASDSSVAAPGDLIPAGAEADTAAATDQHEGPHTGPAQHGYSANKDAYLKRLKRIEGQVRGIARMVDEDKYCIDILTQVAAVTKALHAVSLGLVEEHIGHCVVGAAAEPDPELRSEAIDAKVKEATDAIGRLLR